MPNTTNTITGQIKLQETNQPLPNLAVEVYTIDRHNIFGSGEDAKIRLASGMTDIEGQFQISFEDPEFPITDQPGNNNHGRKWYNPQVEVKDGLIHLFTSEQRNRANRDETFVISLTSNHFEEAGIPIPGYVEEAQDLKTALEKSFDQAEQFEEVKALLKNKVDHARNKDEEKENRFINPFRNALSRLPDSIRNSQYNFVQDGQSVADITKLNISRKIDYVFNQETAGPRPKSKGWIALSEEDQAELFKPEYQQADGTYELPEDLSKEVFQRLIKNEDLSENKETEILSKHPLDKYVKAYSTEHKECMLALGIPFDNNENEDNTPESDNDNGNSNTTDEVQEYINRQMQHSSAPEEPVQFGVGTRATLAEIENRVGALSLRPALADTPSYFDFHSIQIAFEHVWQEAMDEGVLNTARDLYDEIVDLGGTPPEATADKISLTSVKREVRTIAKRIPVKPVDLKIPKHVLEEFPQASKAWQRLTYNGRQLLEKYAEKIQTAEKIIKANPTNFILKHPAEKSKADYLRKGLSIIKEAMEKLGGTTSNSNTSKRVKPGYIFKNGVWVRKQQGRTLSSGGTSRSVDDIVYELEEQLKEKNYSFTTYAANEKERSVNFGILITYRQKWEPTAYQVGELVKTIPLAPKEFKKYSKKIQVKKKRIEKEIENSLRILKSDSSETGRAESEIVNKANKKSSFNRNSTTSNGLGSEEVGGSSSTTTTNFTGDASTESRNLKKSFRESVFKSAQEYKNERKLEIVTEETFESEYTESGEISNPNDELPVTYLFYELQRRYKVNERIHRLRPVVFVAQEMPMPHELDEEWILTHDWIIRRILLDDSFLAALNYLGSITADEFVLEEMEADLAEQRQLVRDIRISFETIKRETETRYRSLQKVIDEQAGIIQGKDWYDGVPVLDTIGNTAESVIGSVTSFLGFGSGAGDDEKEAARIRSEAARDAYDKAEQQQRTLMNRLSGEIDKLQGLSNKYNEKLSEKLQKDVQIARLKVHIKQNILHYMHGIWSHEHPDQRFFRLHNVEVPTLSGEMRLRIDPQIHPRKIKTGYHTQKPAFRFTIIPNIDREFTTLEKVADLDNLLGFKGNYMIFGLKENNALTDYMMAPYIDQELGLKDPDEFGNWTLDDFSLYVCHLKKDLPEEEFNQLVPDLTEAYKKLLNDPLRQGEEIIVPTGSLFIEALPGTHSILEDFKLIHRAIDVKKVQAEVRGMELENIRLAARLQAGELEDPDVGKKVIVEGNGVSLNIDD